MRSEQKRELLRTSALTHSQLMFSGLPRPQTDGSGNVSITGAWTGFCLWAVGEPRIRERFKNETGIDIQWRDEESLLVFSYWVTLNIWGSEGVPEKFLEEAVKRFPDADVQGD